MLDLVGFMLGVCGCELPLWVCLWFRVFSTCYREGIGVIAVWFVVCDFIFLDVCAEGGYFIYLFSGVLWVVVWGMIYFVAWVVGYSRFGCLRNCGAACDF